MKNNLLVVLIVLNLIFFIKTENINAQVIKGTYEYAPENDKKDKYYRSHIYIISDSILFVSHMLINGEREFFKSSYTINQANELKLTPVLKTDFSPILKLEKRAKNDSLKVNQPLLICRNKLGDEAWEFSVLVYKNEKILFKASTYNEIHFENFNELYRFSLPFINNVSEKEYKFSLNEFKGIGNQYFIELDLYNDLLYQNLGMLTYSDNYCEFIENNKLKFDSENIVSNGNVYFKKLTSNY